MAFYWHQTVGMFRRNSLMKRRKWKQTTWEILCPVLLVGLLSLARLAVDSRKERGISNFPSYNISRKEFRLKDIRSVVAGPPMPEIISIMDSVLRFLNMTEIKGYQLHEDVTSTKMDDTFRKTPRLTEAGVQFLLANDSEGSEIVLSGYVLRLPYRDMNHVTQECTLKEGMGSCNDATGLSSDCPGNQALTSGLIQLQYAVETALIQMFLDPGFVPPHLAVQMMPHPEFRPPTSPLQFLVSIGMVVALAPLAYYMALTVAGEKDKMVPYLKILGLRYSLYWCSWFLEYAIIVTIVSVLCTLGVALGGLLRDAGLGFIFVFVTLYCLSLINLAFLISAFFKNTQIAAVATSCLTVVLCLPYLALSLQRSMTAPQSRGFPRSRVSFQVQVLCSLLSPAALALGLDRSVYLSETRQRQSLSAGSAGQFTEITAIIMLILDTVLYGLIAICLDHIRTAGGRHEPWTFWSAMLSKFPCRRQQRNGAGNTVPLEPILGPHIEPVTESRGCSVAIRIRSWRKTFRPGSKRVVYALNDLDLDIYGGHVTCVLGHNKAGKTTLLKTLIGTCAPTSGYACIRDKVVTNLHDREELKNMIGYCPQHDVIIPEMTVEEHLWMCAFLKGMDPRMILEQSMTCIDDVGLTGKKKLMGKELSECQKRKLSIAMALMGNPSVLLLDEPSLRLDRTSRRQLWSLLHAKKHSQVIVMTTRHMEEADLMADRIILLSRGNIRCVGSSHFLQRAFGIGYHLNLDLKPCAKTDAIMKVVKMHVRGASIESHLDNKLVIKLPQAQSNKFSSLFSRLESDDPGVPDLGVNSYNISIITLEEHFHKLAEDEEAGNVFIVQYLQPPDDVFDDGSKRTSQSPSSKPPLSPCGLNQEKANKASTTRHWSFLKDRLRTGELLRAGRRRTTTSASLSPYERSLSEPWRTSNTSHVDAFIRHSPTLSKGRQPFDSNGFWKVPERETSSRYLQAMSTYSTATVSPRVEHASGRKKSKSMAVRALRRCSTTTSLEGYRNEFQSQDGVGDRSSCVGAAQPSASQRVLWSWGDLKRSESSGTDTGSSSDVLSVSGDSVYRVMRCLDALEKRMTTSDRSLLRVGDHVSLTSREGLSGFQNSIGGPKAFQPERGLQEVLSEVTSQEEGMRLQWVKFKALFRVRLLLTVRDSRGLFLRVVFPLLLALLALALSHASTEWDHDSIRTLGRTRVDSETHLVYRNASGANIETFLNHLRKEFGNENLVPDETFFDSSIRGNREKVLEILHPMGSAFNMHYNYTCGLSLPQLTSVVLGTLRRSTSVSSTTTSGSFLGHNRTVRLAQHLSVWLQPWPEILIETPSLVPVLVVGIALAFTPIGYTMGILQERKQEIRNFLQVTGVSRWIYWSSTFVNDVINFIFPIIILVATCFLLPLHQFRSASSIIALVLLFVEYFPVAILWTYAATFAFDSPKTCLVVMHTGIAVFAVGPFLAVYFLDVTGTSATTARVIHYVFTVIFPPYICFAGLHFAHTSKVDSSYHEVNEINVADNAGSRFQFSNNFIFCLIMLAVDLLALPLIIFLLDRHNHSALTLPLLTGNGKSHTSQTQTCTAKRPSVDAELESGKDKETLVSIVVSRVVKMFGNRYKRVATFRDVSLPILRGEVVGLWGPEGAGKTTLIRTILGECRPTCGMVEITFNEEHALESCKGVGYCPQHEPFWGCLNVDQHMDLYGKVRGLSGADWNKIRQRLYEALDLTNYRKEKVSTLPPGILRKMRFAISTLGISALLLLDEPSRCMDPKAKLQYWSTIKAVLKSKNLSAIVATQCLEEVQSLCSQIAIMVNGELRFMGTAEQMMHHYGHGCILDIRLRVSEHQSSEERMKTLKALLRDTFPDLKIRETFRERLVLKLSLSPPHFSVAQAFESLETLKRRLDIEDYTFSQITLHQVYLEFARHQNDNRNFQEYDGPR